MCDMKRNIRWPHQVSSMPASKGPLGHPVPKYIYESLQENPLRSFNCVVWLCCCKEKKAGEKKENGAFAFRLHLPELGKEGKREIYDSTGSIFWMLHGSSVTGASNNRKSVRPFGMPPRWEKYFIFMQYHHGLQKCVVMGCHQWSSWRCLHLRKKWHCKQNCIFARETTGNSKVDEAARLKTET